MRVQPFFIIRISFNRSLAHATVSVQVFSREEAISESNASKPRIYIQNTGTETINNFSYRYFFTTENNKTPVIEPYYLPNKQIMLVPFGNGYYVQYTVTNANLTPGGLLPHSSGNSIGLHFSDWSAWDKTNDFSNRSNSNFEVNQNISVYYNGTKIYGNEPGGISGSVLREVWTNITGTLVSNIPTGTAANIVDALTILETQQQWWDYYGQRIRGYIIPPATGTYYFWIASDDCSELWLSTSDQSTSKVKIASVSGYCAWREWNKYGTQKSAAITLTAGGRYYIEILHKDGNQYDNLSVGWLKPGQSGSVPSEIIPASALSPFVIPTLPNAPGNLTANAISASQVDLSWTDNSNNEDGFRIERALGDGAFVEITQVAANATIFHDAGLTANTQYRYRIRSFNNVGNSATYTSIVSVITLAGVSTLPPSIELNSFAVDSSQSTILKDRCIFNGGGAVGSNTLVEVFPQATVNGNVLSGGTIALKSQADINGDVTAASTITLDAGASVSGTITENAPVATVDIPAITSITIGTEDITVLSGQTRTLTPGYYKTLTVNTGGTLALSAGMYTFSSFFLQPDAIVRLNVALSDMMDIRIAGDLEFSDRSKVLFVDNGYVPFIRFYTNDANTVRIGCDVQLNGTLSAPHGNIAMYSRAQCNGALYGKTISIEPDAVILSDMTNPEYDSDGDGIQNILEVFMGTDPTKDTSYYPIAIPSQAYIDNTQDVTITYDYSRYFPDYSAATAAPATFPAGTLTNPNIPMLFYVSNSPAEGDTFAVDGHTMQGRYICFRPENGLVSGETFDLYIPSQPVLEAIDNNVYQLAGPSWANELLIKTMPTSMSGDGTGSNCTVTGTGSIATAFPNKLTNTTLYFPGGCVFSKTDQIHLQYDMAVTGGGSDLEKITLQVNYTDLVTSTAGVKPMELSSIVEGAYKNFYGNDKMFFTNPVRIDACVLTLKYTGAPTDIVYTQTCGSAYKIDGSRLMVLYARTTPSNLFISGPLSREQIAISYYSEGYSFESADFGEGRIVTNYTAGSGSPYATYEYFLKDHLGSTRMVINDEGNIVEATMYQPYGTMTSLPIGMSSAINVRKKFTGKEFDEEGAVLGKLDLAMNFQFTTADLDLDNTELNFIRLYYTPDGTPDADARYEQLPLTIDEALNKATLQKIVMSALNREVKWIRIVLNGAGTPVTGVVDCKVEAVDEAIGPGNLVTIGKTVTAKSQLPATLAKTDLTITHVSGNAQTAMNQYYFGARYYDPELGVWGSVDPAGQYVNSYTFTPNNPLRYIDVDGGICVLTHFIIGLEHGTWYGANPDYWNYSKYIVGVSGLPGGEHDLNPPEEYPKGSAQRDITTFLHSKYGELNWVYDFIQGKDPNVAWVNGRPAGLTEQEWKGVKAHLLADYFNQGAGSTPLSPLEHLGGKKWREDFQDVKDLELVIPLFFPDPVIASLLTIDWVIGVLNLSAATRGLEWMIDNNYYIKGMENGKPRPSFDLGTKANVEVANVSVRFYDRNSGALKEEVDISGRDKSAGYTSGK